MATEDRRRQTANRLGAASWGVFFLWVGACWLLAVDLGITLIGIAAITFIAQTARVAMRLDVEWPWIVVGSCFAIGGVAELAEREIPVAPILLVLAGVLLLGGTMIGWRRRRHQ